MKLLATLFLFMATNLWAESCKEFFKSETLLKEVSILNELNKEGLLWKGFDLSNELVIFTDVKKFPRCFALYKNLRIISEVETNEGIDIPNGIYNFFHPYNRPKLERLGSELKKHDANFSMLVSLHSWELFPEYLSRIIAGNYFVSNLIFHEAFHLFVQIKSLIDPDAGVLWPKWGANGSDRDQLIIKCYQNKLVKDLFDKEVQSLFMASQLLYLFGDSKLAVEAAKDFISYRKKRYKKLNSNNVKVPRDEGSYVSCPDAEAEWEITEGVANYVGAMVLRNANLMTPFQFIEYARTTVTKDAFYSFGQMELYLLRGLFPNEFDLIIEKINNSSNIKNNIFNIFTLYLKGP